MHLTGKWKPVWINITHCLHLFQWAIKRHCILWGNFEHKWCHCGKGDQHHIHSSSQMVLIWERKQRVNKAPIHTIQYCGWSTLTCTPGQWNWQSKNEILVQSWCNQVYGCNSTWVMVTKPIQLQNCTAWRWCLQPHFGCGQCYQPFI